MPGGPAFDHPEWQCVQQEIIGGQPVLKRVGELDNVHGAVFVNPLHEDVRSYELSVIREICENYDIDGIILDRMRYPNLFADFSDLSRDAFEKYTGKVIDKWPDDVLVRNSLAVEEAVPGPLSGHG